MRLLLLFSVGCGTTLAVAEPVADESELRDACDDGDAASCTRFAMLRLAEGDLPGATAPLGAGCTAGSPAACELLRGFELCDGTPGCGLSPQRISRDDLRAACEAGENERCHQLGLALLHDDDVGAEAAFKRACDNGAMQSCAELTFFHQRRGDVEGALALARGACQAGERLGCDRLESMLGARCDAKQAGSCEELGTVRRQP